MGADVCGERYSLFAASRLVIPVCDQPDDFLAPSLLVPASCVAALSRDETAADAKPRSLLRTRLSSQEAPVSA